MSFQNLAWGSLYLVIAIMAGTLGGYLYVHLQPTEPQLTKPVEHSISFGLAKSYRWSSEQYFTEAEAHGLTGHYLIYYNVSNKDNVAKPYEWVRLKYLGRGKPVIMALILSDSEKSIAKNEVAGKAIGNLRQIVAGHFDEHILKLARAIARTDVEVMIRLMPEGDGDWFEWSMYADGNTPELYADAWNHVVDLFSSVNAPVKFQFNPNRRDANSKVLGDFDRYYPRMKNVHSVAVSTYNRCKTAKNIYQESRSFAEEFAPIYSKLVQVLPENIPINVAETATTSLCGPKLPWYKDQLHSFKAIFHRVREVSYYLDDVFEGEGPNKEITPWALNREQKVEFRKLIESAK